MDSKYSVREISDQHLKLWIYLLPIVGVIPAVWTLYRQQGDRQQQNTSRLAINLLLVWLASYVLLSLGAEGATDSLAFRLLYVNTLLTSGYFITCTVLMLRLRRLKTK
ncbi:MAG: hypothetical protein Tsb0014_07720 [Pleurocapsa sp.]